MSSQDREARVERLKPYRWKAGQSGNPKGRPKRRSLEELVNDILDDPVGDIVDAGDPGETGCQRLARLLVEAAVESGDGQALKLLLDRIWPAPRFVDFKAHATVDRLDEDDFPRASIASLSDEDRETLQRIAHKAIMGGGRFTRPGTEESDPEPRH
jgi:hypothetical protein